MDCRPSRQFMELKKMSANCSGGKYGKKAYARIYQLWDKQ